MKQRKILSKPSAARPLAKGSGLIDAENRKPAYVSPQVSVVYVALESGIAAASIESTTTPQITDWGTGSGDGDIAIN